MITIYDYFQIETFLLLLGVGKSFIIYICSLWAERILLKVGDNPLKVRVLKVAMTGKAASIIGKIFSFFNKYVFTDMHKLSHHSRRSHSSLCFGPKIWI